MEIGAGEVQDEQLQSGVEVKELRCDMNLDKSPPNYYSLPVQPPQ
jgi:hypothetical protein